MYEDSFGIFSDDYKMFFTMIVTNETPISYKFLTLHRGYCIFCEFNKEHFVPIEKYKNCFFFKGIDSLSEKQKQFLNNSIDFFFSKNEITEVEYDGKILKIIPKEDYTFEIAK